MPLSAGHSVPDLRLLDARLQSAACASACVGCCNMSAPIDKLLSRLDARANGPNRWRCACPVCGGGNRSTLSIGTGDTGAVLVKCFKSGCGAEAVAQAVGLEINDLFPPKESSGSALRRRRLISDRQALALLHDESQLIALCGANIGHGIPLTDADRAACLAAAGNIAYIYREVRS
jgi:hypothetical protein